VAAAETAASAAEEGKVVKDAWAETGLWDREQAWVKNQAWTETGAWDGNQVRRCRLNQRMQSKSKAPGTKRLKL
jgi:hypothetical protein